MTPKQQLTPRETEVRNLTIHRRTPKQMAKALRVSLETIYVYRASIRRKMGIPPNAPTTGELTPRQREAVELRKKGYTHRQIAQWMKIHEQSVATLIYTARLRAKQREAATRGTMEDPAFA